MLDKRDFLTLRLNDDFQLEIGSRERERISHGKSVEVSIRTDTTCSGCLWLLMGEGHFWRALVLALSFSSARRSAQSSPPMFPYSSQRNRRSLPLIGKSHRCGEGYRCFASHLCYCKPYQRSQSGYQNSSAAIQSVCRLCDKRDIQRHLVLYPVR